MLESQKQLATSKILNKASIEIGKKIESGEEESVVLDDEVRILKEARRQYLLGVKKNRKYVASTLFYGRYDKHNQVAKTQSNTASGSVKSTAHRQNNIKYISHPLKMLVIQ